MESVASIFRVKVTFSIFNSSETYYRLLNAILA
jgi:hypothetical protein